MSLNVARLRQCLQSFDFRPLFIQELGWDKHSASVTVAVDGQTFCLQPIAEKRGFQVFECPPGSTGTVPDHPIRSRAHASPLLQDTVASQDFFEKTRVQGGCEAFPGNAVLGRVSL